MNLRKRITIILSIGLFIVLLVGMNAYRTVQQLVKLNSWVIHTHLVLQKTQHVQALLTGLDNDLRGHLLTENPFFSADYDRNAQQMTAELRQLQTLTTDNPVQRSRFDQLLDLLTSKLMHSELLFKDNAVTQGNARLDSVRYVLNISDRCRLILQASEENEKDLLTARNAESDLSANYAIISNSVGAVLALSMIAWAIYLLIQTLETSSQHNKKLKDSEQRIQKFLEAVPISVVVIDVNGDFYYANKAAADLFGNAHSHFDTYANTLAKISIYRSSDGQPYPVTERPIYRALRGETAQIDDMEMRVGDRSVQVMTSASPVYNSDGVLQYVVSSSVDISDRAHSQLRLQQAKEMAEEAARLKENFLANMSHEIRTPLNAMLGFSNLLEMTPLDEEQKEFVYSIRTAGKNLLTIVNDILDISKIEAGMLQFESIPFNVNSLAGSIQMMLQSAANDKHLKLTLDSDPTLPSIVLGDPTRLTQILLNLISNSIKFTKDGGVKVTIRKVEETDESVRVRFAVEDTGIGMAADILPHIFERFRQATDFTTRYYGGTGLGLNIVKSLTEMQGGWITVESTLGQGSCFTLELSYLIAPQQAPLDNTLSVAAPGPDGRLLNVLVVEDNMMNQRLAIQVLKRLGYTAQIAENGEKALEILQQDTRIDVVLMDIQMPVMDGYETTRHIRNTLHSTVPIIAMTAHALASEREQCLQAGMNDFIPKPFQMEELQRILRKYVWPISGKAAADVVVTKPEPADEAPKTTFSVESLLSSVGDDADFAAEVLALFLSQTTGELEKLQHALATGDLTTIGNILHTQKVPTKMFGMTKATRLILAVEALLADKKDIADVGPILKQYLTLLQVELPLIKTVLQTTFKRPIDVDL